MSQVYVKMNYNCKHIQNICFLKELGPFPKESSLFLKEVVFFPRELSCP